MFLFPLAYFPYGKHDHAHTKDNVVDDIEVVQKQLKEQPIGNPGYYVLAVVPVLQQLQVHVHGHKNIVEKRAVDHANANAYVGSLFFEAKDVVNEFAYVPHMLHNQESASLD